MGSSMSAHKSRSRGKDVMKQHAVHFKAEFTISEGKIKEYKKLIKEMSKLVEANEPETINYQFYFDKSKTMCTVHETYMNSEAVFFHINRVASQTVIPKIHDISRITKFVVYGTTSKKLQKAMERLNPQIYVPFAGFNR
ncbi:putative antibiotic biosynthesis monooxygenase (modular protein) [Candidatus Nitrosocosmicus arcticus]|uniref:Putative antibiotic biosynthesis monooxygenase (Modular protein) n=2 Tax=Candidatus Nitrosocosmicus arcticus TaxID=2035267 RepID=A0A557SZE9_9ARCH|nr:putative antibiotic biosynthesis monooxygenase (modular protein) [Candidatus Nitrosocosmicus arcticus]